MINEAVRQALDGLGRRLKPRDPLNVWQWADRYRYLAKGISQKSRHGPARYSSAVAPHQRAPQESMTDPAVQVTVLIMASQIGGKTEMISNVLGYHMDYRPANCVVMYPTIDSAEKFSKKKLMPNIDATPCLSAIIAPSKSRTSSNTILVKDFLGGSIFMVGANSPASLRQASGEVLLADEIDSYESDVGGEGDPVDLLWKRGESFPGCIKVVSSTPTIKGRSRIWNWFELSDQQYWFMPCVHCGQEIRFTWAMVEWPKGKPDKAEMLCPECKATINDRQRLDMYHVGKWKPTAPFNGVRGFHLNWLYCPWAPQKGYENRLHQMAAEWSRAAKAGKENEKVLVNTGLCECWEEQMEKAPDFSGLLFRCEDYPHHLPEGVLCLTAAVDTQKDRLECEVIGWGLGEESWGIEVVKFAGSPQDDRVWRDMDRFLLSTWDHPLGGRMGIACVLVDSGGQSDSRGFNLPVYKFAHPRRRRRVFACKGSSEVGAPAVVSREQKSGIILQVVGTDVCKSVVYERLEVIERGPRFCHFPKGRGYDEEYFRQLTSECIMQSKNKGSTRRVWVKMRARNEALDLRAYNVAAFEVLNPNLPILHQNMAKPAEHPPEPPKSLVVSHSTPQDTGQAQTPPAQRAMRRRSRFVRW